MSDDLDVLVLGGGVAGLSSAIRAAQSGARVAVVTKTALGASATQYAQGGVAAVLEEDVDSPELHLADTLGAGAGLCDVDAVRVLVEEGPTRVRELMAMGAHFDESGEGLAFTREVGHTVARIVHAGGDATGAEIQRALIAAVRGAHDISVIEHALVLEPTNTDTIGNAAALAMNLGRLDIAIALNEYANARDPVNPTGYQNIGVAYSNAGRQDEAIESYRTALSLSPDLAGAHREPDPIQRRPVSARGPLRPLAKVTVAFIESRPMATVAKMRPRSIRPPPLQKWTTKTTCCPTGRVCTGRSTDEKRL
jgi:tetratricopeptide (TPR) repeat protein